MVDAFDRESSLTWSRRERLSIVDEAPAALVRVKTNPTRADPAVTMTPDQSSFCCWVESRSDGDRWLFLSPDGDTYVGPAYEGEDSLPQIASVLARWLGEAGLAEQYAR